MIDYILLGEVFNWIVIYCYDFMIVVLYEKWYVFQEGKKN